MSENEQYAVVREADLSRVMSHWSFSKFHTSWVDARNEAMRLALKEGAKFYVLKVVGYAESAQPPVVWVNL